MKVFLRYTPEKSEVLPTITYFGKKKISDKFHLAIYTLVNKRFSEALVGFTYAPKKWIKIGLSSGIENNAISPVGYRFGSSLWLGKGKNSLFSIFEKGDGSTFPLTVNNVESSSYALSASFALSASWINYSA